VSALCAVEYVDGWLGLVMSLAQETGWMLPATRAAMLSMAEANGLRPEWFE